MAACALAASARALELHLAPWSVSRVAACALAACLVTSPPHPLLAAEPTAEAQATLRKGYRALSESLPRPPDKL